MLSLTFLIFTTFCASLCFSFKPSSSQGSYYILDLQGKGSDLSMLAKTWNSYNFKSSNKQAQTFDASGVEVVGGSDRFKIPYSHLEKLYDYLPEHSHLAYTLSIVVIGDWKSSDQISISADGSIIASFRPYIWKTDKIKDLWIDISGRTLHNKDTLVLRISANLPSQTSEKAHFGIHNVKLSFITDNTPHHTKTLYCPNGICKYTENQVCPIGKFLHKQQHSECQTCPTGCSSCWGSEENQCYSCDLGYTFNGISCIECQDNSAQFPTTEIHNSHPQHPIRQLQSTTLTVDEINDVNDMARISKIGTVWAGLGLQIVNIVYPSNIGYTTNISIKRMFQYLKYLSVSRSLKLELFFGLSYFVTGNTILEKTIPDELIVDMYGDLKFVNYPLPVIFQYYNVQSNFLANMAWVLTFLLITFGIFLCFLLAKFLCRWLRNITVLRFILKKSLIIAANLFIAQFYATIGDIVFFSSLQFRALHSGGPSGNIWSIVSMSLCLFLGIVLLLLNFWVIKKLQNILQDSLSQQQAKIEKAAQHKKKCEWVQIFHLDFHETSLFRQSFLLVFMVRSILFNLVLTLLFEHPLTQIIIIVVLNMAILAYLIIQRPFISLIEFFQQIVFELLIAICNICTLIIAISDRGNGPSLSLVTNIGDVIMGVTLAYSFVPFFFIALHIINLFYKFHKINQSEKAAAKVHHLLQTPAKKPAMTNAETNMNLMNNSPEALQLSQLQTQENENGPPIAIEDQNTARPLSLIPEDSERVQMIEKEETLENQPHNLSFQGAEETISPQTEKLIYTTNSQPIELQAQTEAEAANIIPTTEVFQNEPSLELLDPENAVVQPQSHLEFLKTPSPIHKEEEEEEQNKVLLDSEGHPIEIIPGPSLLFEMTDGATTREKLKLKSYLPPGKNSEPAGTQNAIKSQEIDKSTQPDLENENPQMEGFGEEGRPANQINLFGGTAETRRGLPDGPGYNSVDYNSEPPPLTSPRVQSPRVQSPRVQSPRVQSAQTRKNSMSPEEKALKAVEEEKESLEQFKKLTDLTRLDYEWELDGNTHVGSPYFVKTYLERQDPEKDSAGRIFNKRISELVEDI